MSKPHNVRAPVGKYTAKDGSEKTEWANIGVAFPRPDGTFSLRLKAIPVGWDGNCIIVPPLEDTERDGGYQQRPQREYQREQPTQQRRPQQSQGGADEDIPFSDPLRGKHGYAI